MTSSNPVLKNARFNPGFQSENNAIELQEKSRNNNEHHLNNQHEHHINSTDCNQTRSQDLQDKPIYIINNNPPDQIITDEKPSQVQVKISDVKEKSVTVNGHGEDSEFEDEENPPTNFCATGTEKVTTCISDFTKQYQGSLRFLLAVTLLCGYIAYFIYSIIYSIQLAIPLIVLTSLVVLILSLYGLVRLYGERINKQCCQPLALSCSKHWKYLKW